MWKFSSGLMAKNFQLEIGGKYIFRQEVDVIVDLMKDPCLLLNFYPITLLLILHIYYQIPENTLLYQNEHPYFIFWKVYIKPFQDTLWLLGWVTKSLSLPSVRIFDMIQWSPFLRYHCVPKKHSLARNSLGRGLFYVVNVLGYFKIA